METFEAAPTQEERGTVRGADTYGAYQCGGSEGSGDICSCEATLCVAFGPDSHWCTQAYQESPC